jgi:hypothetical protein
LTETFRILLKHYLIGSLVVALIFWFLNEIPNFDYINRHLLAFITTVISIPLIGLLISKLIDKYLADNGFRVYFLSFLSIFATWILLLYTKALVVGIISTFKTGEFEIIESLIGYSVYQLWIYAGIGLIHGVFGAIFLGMELKRNLNQKSQVTLV